MGVKGSVYGALGRVGRSMTLRRRTTSPPTDATVKGVTKGYEPSELVGAITQGDVRVIFSDTDLTTAGWPTPPVKGDYMVIDGKERSIMSIEPKYLGDSLVVYECHVKG